MKRGELWWASLLDPAGSGPGYRRPVVIVSSNEFNESAIATVIIAAVTTNLRLGDAPGNVRLRRGEGGIPKESVVNVSQLFTLDRGRLTERLGALPASRLQSIETGMRLVLAL